mgnify:CR=1 FL=1
MNINSINSIMDIIIHVAISINNDTIQNVDNNTSINNDLYIMDNKW